MVRLHNGKGLILGVLYNLQEANHIYREFH